MDARNADGVRVASAFLLSEGLVVGGTGERFTVETRVGLLDVQVSAGGMVRVDLGRWKFGQRDAHAVEVLLGGSHTVTLLNSVAELELVEFPDGPPATSVNERVFAAPEQPLVDDGIGRVRVRVFRSGVGEVASSGTGAAAAALAMRHITGAGSTHNWRAESAGGSIGVQMFPTEDGEHVSIHGLAVINSIETVEP
jgi:diaminopimelate epimerase